MSQQQGAVESLSASLPSLGIIANPVSARDIRRIIANASNLQIADRVNIVLRVLTTVASLGVKQVFMMPDKGGIAALLLRSLRREKNLHHSFPKVSFVDMQPTSTVEDTLQAVRLMHVAGVGAIVVLGGDGTHRAVVSELMRLGAQIPLAGLSTGTNNAFPEMREPTVTALAVGLYLTGRLDAKQALASNKLLEVSLNDGERRDIALVDAVISTDRYIGARALWKTGNLAAVYLSFAEPEAIGLSSIGGLLHPLGRRDPGGLAVQLCHAGSAPQVRLQVPIAPGMVRNVDIRNWASMTPDQPYAVELASGVVALDGEREMTFDDGDRVTVTLREHAFPTVDVSRCMQIAARTGVFRSASISSSH